MMFNGPNEGYNVTYRRLETNENSTVSVTNTAVNISGLEIYEEYNIEVVALSDKGAGDNVAILVLTDEDCKIINNKIKIIFIINFIFTSPGRSWRI